MLFTDTDTTKCALEWMVLLLISTHGSYCDWAQDALSHLELGCMQLPYTELKIRQSSILDVYKHSGNPEGYRTNKCYIRYQQLEEERKAKAEETRKRVQEALMKTEEAKRQKEAEDLRQKEKKREKEIEDAKEQKRINQITLPIAIVVIAVLVIVGICACGLHKRQNSALDTVGGAGQSLLPGHPEVTLTTRTAGFNPNNLDSQTTFLSSRSTTPVPRRSVSPVPRRSEDPVPPTGQSRNADTRILLDEPPSYDEAVRTSTPLPSAPPKEY